MASLDKNGTFPIAKGSKLGNIIMERWGDNAFIVIISHISITFFKFFTLYNVRHSASFS